jgi:DNA-binding transcriptional ArsR family regulator
MNEADVSFQWMIVAARFIHPLKVAIVEALFWIEQPLSATAISKMCSGLYTLSLVSYHMKDLEAKGIIEVTAEQPSRGVAKKLYWLSSTDREHDEATDQSRRLAEVMSYSHNAAPISAAPLD